ncbi:hypothetical protein PSPO01_01821 [Paraphaeosphaeria sporulosa]
MPSPKTLLSFYTSLIKSLLAVIFARLYKPQEIPPKDLRGQTAIVTGANSGIGLSIAVALAKQGTAVCLACRNPDRGAAAVEYVTSSCSGNSQGKVTCRILDVGDLTSVRSFCEKWDGEIDMLVHNAGIAEPASGGPIISKEGLDIMYTTNFLGSFLMTHLLKARLSPTARVNIVHPVYLHRIKDFLGITESSAPTYALTKAQQVLFASLLQSHFSASPFPRRTAHAFTPGFTSTPIFGKLVVSWQTWFSNPLFAALKMTEKWIAVDTDEGAKTGVWLATWGNELGIEGKGGGFWEWMEWRTSFVELMGETRKEREWDTWERDAGAVWDR